MVPVLKIIGHLTAAAVVVAYGFQVRAITLGGNETFQLGYAAIPLTILWLVMLGELTLRRNYRVLVAEVD